MIPFPYKDENPSPSSRLPIWAIIGLNLAAIVFWTQEGVDALGFIPAKLEAHRWISTQFLHAGLGHLAGNMWFLWIFGDNVAGRLRGWFLPFYIAGGAAACYLHFATHPGAAVPLVGASGAVAAVIGAYLVLFPAARLRCMLLLVVVPIFYSVKALWFGLAYIATQTLMVVLTSDSDTVAYGAHLGGVVFGVAVGSLLRHFSPEEAVAVAGADDPAGGGSRAARERIERHLTHKREEQAVADYVATVRRDPYFELGERAQLWMGDRLARAGHPHLAKGALERFLLRHPEHAQAAHASLLLGFVEQNEYGDLDAAVRAYERALGHAQATPEIRRDAESRLAAARARLEETFVEEPREGELYRVLLESITPLSSAQLGRLAALVGRPAEAVRAQLEQAPGVIAAGLPRERAARVAGALEAQRVPVVLVGQDRLVPLPPARLVDAVAVEEGGLALTGEGARANVPWERCLLVAAVGVRARRAEGAPLHLLEVVAGAPLERFRWAPGGGAGAGPETERLFFGFLQELLLRARGVPVNQGAQAAFKRKLPDSAVLADLDRVERYLGWHLQLAALRRPALARP